MNSAAGGSAMTSKDLAQLINDFRKYFPFESIKSANQHLHSKLKKTGGNEYFTVFTSESSLPAIDSVELRANFEKPSHKQLLIVQLKNSVSSKIADFEQAFGVKGKEMGFTTPHIVRKETYSSFPVPGMEIRITFDLKPNALSFALDSFEQ